ncbi:MAG: S8 family serine peptidase [Actinobacteria bacterium]|nr:S8 family serine peptidase [Actinomycetota bacterium]
MTVHPYGWPHGIARIPRTGVPVLLGTDDGTTSMTDHPTALRRSSGLLALALLATVAPAATAAPAAASSRVVVTALSGDVAAAARAVQAAGGAVLDRIPLIGAVTADLPDGTVLAPSYRVVPNSPLSVASTGSAVEGPASTVRGTLGLGAPAGEGAGVTVAVVDTGVANVAELAGRLDHVDVSGAGVGDGYGHGTFVAGLVAGGTVGVAPGAHVLDVRVAKDDGSTDLATVLKGLQAVAARRDVSVLNLSLSSGSPLPYQVDPLTSALEALWRRGITVVVPSGNDPREVSSPGTDPVLLTVGGLDETGTATRGDDVVAGWSGRGTPQGVERPDLVAPGAHLVSLRVQGSVIDRAYADTAAIDPEHFRGSGTSFAAGVTSGAVAALLAKRPGLSPNAVKGLLTSSTYEVSAPQGGAGAGGLDLAAALAGRTTGTGPVNSRADEVVPGDARDWAAFLDALEAGDRGLAASSWSKLTPAARNWAASSWSDLSFEARNWAARNWAARNWAGADGTLEEWAARNWAARNWAARNWADAEFAASSWSARNWAASSWSARNWAVDGWSARNWAGEDWAARNWAARNWSARNWSGLFG